MQRYRCEILTLFSIFSTASCCCSSVSCRLNKSSIYLGLDDDKKLKNGVFPDFCVEGSLIFFHTSRAGWYSFPVANNAQAVRTVLFASAMHARFMPARLTSSINQASLAVLGTVPSLDITANAP